MGYPHFCYDLSHAVQGCRRVKTDLVAMKNIRQLHISSFIRQGDRTHMSILANKTKIEAYVALAPHATRCIELSPGGFGPDPMDSAAIVKALTQTREFLESIE